MQVESALLFETPEQIFARVFRDLKPRTPLPQIGVEFCRFANPDSYARSEEGRLGIRMSDLLEGAPAPVLEALAYILLGKLYRKRVPAAYAHRYRLYLNRRDMRSKMHLVRQIRGRKFVSGPQGEHRNLDLLFDELNLRYFDGLMAKPLLGWSRRPSRTLLDSVHAPPLVLQYVLFHEMLHLRFPIQTQGARRRVHTREFREAEKQFEQWKEAKALLRKL